MPLAKPLTTADIGIQLLMDSTVCLQEIEARITPRVFAAVHNPERSPLVGAALHAARISEALPLRRADVNCCLTYRVAITKTGKTLMHRAYLPYARPSPPTGPPGCWSTASPRIDRPQTRPCA